eukprot:9485303-Prorocentrum_lima.AAC.1
MTSSLVGSEMCIRDSDMALHGKLKTRYNICATRKSTIELRYLRDAQELCCLLYTSDAADDM